MHDEETKSLRMDVIDCFVVCFSSDFNPKLFVSHLQFISQCQTHPTHSLMSLCCVVIVNKPSLLSCFRAVLLIFTDNHVYIFSPFSSHSPFRLPVPDTSMFSSCSVHVHPRHFLINRSYSQPEHRCYE